MNFERHFFLLSTRKDNWKQCCVCVCVCVSHSVNVGLFVTQWTVTDGLSMEFSRQEYWSGLPFPPPGIFLTQGSNLGLLHCRQILYPATREAGDNARPRSTKKCTRGICIANLATNSYLPSVSSCILSFHNLSPLETHSFSLCLVNSVQIYSSIKV